MIEKTDREPSWDLFRLTKSKATVDLAPNTVRKLIRDGLAAYKNGRAVFISKTELAAFIKSHK